MRRHGFKLAILLFVFLSCLSVLAQEGVPAAEGLSCREYYANGEMFEAVIPCRNELEAHPESVELQRILAEVEFVAGEPERSVELWQAIVDSSAADQEASSRLAMALWRSGKTNDAENLLVENVKTYGDVQAYRDLVNFYNSFDRFDEALECGTKARKKFPESCDVDEDLGVTQAALGNDKEAAALLEKAITAGCPPFRWTTRGVFAQRLDSAYYAQLLAPEKLIAGIDELNDADCRMRLSLLKNTMSSVAGSAVTGVVIKRRTPEVRLVAIGLLSQLAADGAPFWQEILETEDFILRKYALRTLRELQEPAFIPLLEECLETNLTPGNRALAKLTLGELLMRADEIERGEAMILSIKDDTDLYGIGLLSLATFYEKADPARALSLIEQALEVSPELYVDPNRITMLEEKTTPQ